MVQNRVFALFIVGFLTFGCSSGEDGSTQNKDADTTDSGDALVEASPNDAGTDSQNDTNASDVAHDTNASDATDDTNASDATDDTNASDATDDTNASDAPDSAETPQKFSILDFGATPNDKTDDTAAVQKAVDAAAKEGGIVSVPSGVFLIDPVKSINMKSNTALHLENHATLKAIGTDKANSAVVKISEVSDVEVTGGLIEGERYAHTGNTGEWGMGITILGSKRVHISNVRITDCWGDGIYVGAGKLGYCEDVTIENFTVHNNRRQGISVISAKNLLIKDGVASKTNGTPMQAGIDLEPNNDKEYLLNVTLENIHTKENVGDGLIMGLGRFAPAPATDQLKVTIINHTDFGSRKAQRYIDEAIAKGYDVTIK